MPPPRHHPLASFFSVSRCSVTTRVFIQDIGIMTMQQGERSVLCISPEYGYGKYGKPPSIPANATLTYDVELLDWTDPPVMSQMSVAMFGFSLVLGIMAWSGLQS
uniref:peptidylprolyl isomerase n=1 Tax=Lotharella globosa TaxID=91324 RepID=A0A7S4DMV7_9EUKA